jgi:YidC/Oxa1 family membrane protein insertase
MDVLSYGVAWLLAFFYGLIPSYGVAIILLTLSIMVVLTPLTLKGTRSMMAMQQLQPELKKIQTEYKDDREKLNEELMAFYKENSINPLGGCLPLLAQMPVFLVLFQVLRGLTRRAPDLGSYSGWVMGQLGLDQTPGDPPTVVTERMFDPAFVPQASDMYHDLSQSFEMRFLGLDLSESASVALSVSVVHALPYFVLILLVAFTGWFQQRQIQGRNTGATQSSQQQMIMKLMPIMLPVISFSLPAGLVLYFLVSNTYRIGQQAWITRTLYTPDGPVTLSDKAITENPDPKTGSGAKALPGAADAASGNGSPRKSQGKGRATPKRSEPPAPTKRTGGSANKKTKKARKTYTSDPKAKGRAGREAAGPAKVEPRGRKSKKKKG